MGRQMFALDGKGENNQQDQEWQMTLFSVKQYLNKNGILPTCSSNMQMT